MREKERILNLWLLYQSNTITFIYVFVCAQILGSEMIILENLSQVNFIVHFW